MKLQLYRYFTAAFLCLAVRAGATTYYIDDNSNDGDVYTPGFTGNPANDALSPTTPKLDLNNLLASTNLLPGDIVLIDAGTYTKAVVIANTVNGVAGNRIVFQGAPSERYAESLSIFAPTSGTAFVISGNHLHFRDIQTQGGGEGFKLFDSSFGEYERIRSTGTSGNPLYVTGASNSNAFRHCLFVTTANAAAISSVGNGNYVEFCTGYSVQASAIYARGLAVSNVVNCILVGDRVSTTADAIPSGGTRNVLWGNSYIFGGHETLSELQHINTNWHHNTVADPKFVNVDALDFHAQSAAGVVSNGVWVTNPAVGYSAAIDFGPRE